MLITNLELAQATLEIFAGFICLLIMTIVIINRHRNEEMKFFLWMFGVSAMLFFAEAAAYIFRGNVDNISLFMTRASNFTVFMLNLVLGGLCIRYIQSLLKTCGITASKFFLRFADACILLGMGILVLNLFTGWMYSFDSSNYYHRAVLWYVYTALSVLCLFTGVFMAIRYRRIMGKATIFSVAFFAVVPILAILIQSFLYGLAITNLGIAIAILLLFISYLVRWRDGQYEDKEEDDKRRRLLQVIVLFVIMTVVMSASIVSCIISIRTISAKNSKDDSQLIAHMVASGIQEELLRPITVAKTICRDADMKNILKKSAAEGAESTEEEMTEYLQALKQGFGYQMVFAVCAENGAYYTYKGITKYIDPEHDEHDIWYSDFVESGKEYDLNVDTDEGNDYALAVFVNSRVYDENNELIGVSGVAVTMTALQTLLKQYEREYGVQVVLTNEAGLIQVAGDGKRIEEETISTEDFKKDSVNFTYTRKEQSSRLVRYMPNFDWYMVVEDMNPEKIDIREVTLPSIIIFIVGLFMMTVAFSVVTIREQKLAKQLAIKREASITDELTGLLNRRGYEEEIERIKEKKTLHNLAYIMMDLNGLKGVNDNLGHNAGDEYIIGAAKCMISPFAKYGKVYRIGGDEFVAMLRCTKAQAEDSVNTLNYLVENWRGQAGNDMSISVGLVYGGDEPKLSLEEIIQLSDKRMYEEKEKYYIRTGKVRRK